MRIVVEHYQADRIPNPNPRGETTDAEFWRARKAVVTACRKHGVTGPDDKQSPRACWVVDDQYNDELYQYMEILSRSFLSAECLQDLIFVLRDFPGWGIGVGNIRFAYLLIFADRLMVTGYPFSGCNDLESVAAAASANLWGVEGEEEPYTWERWHRSDILASDICGCYYCCTLFPPTEIADWTDKDNDDATWTAICPNCGKSKVIAPKSRFRLERAALRKLSELAFGPFHTRGT